MTKKETIKWLESLKAEIGRSEYRTLWHYVKSIDMAIKALQVDVVCCENCEYQNECEEIVLFDINDDEVMGHRVHWCSYGRSENDKTRKT